MRRILIALALTGLAQPALAQVPGGTAATAELWQRQEMDRQRMIGLQNDMVTLEGRVRTEQAARDLRDARSPAPPLTPGPAAAAYLPSATPPEISDARLARSNAAVLAASRGRDVRERGR